ncbi:hypothetical protein [Streptomyces avermitilis]|uniref:hypothetical protein n=1 Tax=Streptomyces avermitilis TaxID=33903 RepID=UPI00371E54A3
MRIPHAQVPRCDVRRTESTTDLLSDLYSSEPDFAPYMLTAWSPELTAQDTVVPPYLALLLDEPSTVRKPRTGHTASQRLTWQCTIRNTAGVELNDADWFKLTREVLDATGIEPAACRWAPLRNQAHGLPPTSSPPSSARTPAPPAQTPPTTTASTSRGDRRRLSPISGRA